MDIDILRGLATLGVFIAFIGICIAVYSRKRKDFYEQAGKIPFQDDPAPAREEENV